MSTVNPEWIQAVVRAWCDDDADPTVAGDARIAIETVRPLIEAELRELADALAGSLALMLYDAHPTYGNTTGWHGGIGGQALTAGCSVIDPPPGAEWTQMDLLSTALREYIAAYPFDLEAVKEQQKARALAMLNGGPDA